MPRYIDADALKLGINKNDEIFCTPVRPLIIDLIDDIPTADVREVKHGRWIPSFKNAENEKAAKMLGFDLDEFVQKSAYCSVCGIQQITNGRDKTGKARIHKAIFRYCPYCGAKMDSEAKTDET